MPKKSNIDIKSISKDVVEKGLKTFSSVPSATPEAPKEEPAKPGRRKVSKITRDHAKTVYFEESMLAALEDVKFNNRVNMQRVIQTAIHDFLERYMVAGKLTEEGMTRIAKYDETVTL